MTANLHILGPAQLRRNGKTIRLRSAKAIALIAYLVCRPQIAHSRDSLAALFWGSFPEAKARQSLRQVLYSLRRGLGDAAQKSLVADLQTITFFPSPHFHVDILEFERQIASGNHQSAVKLYQGTLLDGITIDDCPEFDEWLFLARDRTAQHMVGALQGAIDGCLAEGRSAEAIELGLRFVVIDPLNEGAYRRLMRAYAAQGELDAVGRYYRQCRTVLQRELGVEPAAKTTALYKQLLSPTAVPTHNPPSPPPVPTLSFPYEGCEAELAQLQDLFSQAKAGQNSLLFVKGETGSGKSELLFEFWRRTSADRPLSLLVGRAYEAELGAPYVMWSEALAALTSVTWQQQLSRLSPVWREQLARLVPGIGVPEPAAMNITAAENQLRFMQGIVQCLIHLSSHAPLLLFFDDVQWSDTASLELLHYAARQCRSHPILIVGAYSSDSSSSIVRLRPFIDERRHPTIEISPVQQADIQALLSQLDMPASTAVVSRLHQHCHGNRLMLVETLRLMQESGRIDQLITASELPIPPSIHELIRTRLARLTEQQRRVLAAAAVIGRPCSSTLLRQVNGQSELDLLEDVDTLISRAFLEETEGTAGEQISFHHEFVRQITLKGLRQSQRLALHQRTAVALLAIHQSRPDLVVEEVALHFEQARDERGLNYLILAAEQAESFFALPQAAQLLSRALAFQDQYLAEDVYDRFDILLAREKLLSQQGRQTARAADITSLLSLAKTMADPQRMAQAIVRQAGYLSDTRQSQESKEAAGNALAIYRQARDRLGEAQTLRELGFICWSASEYGLALVYGRRALQLHRQLGDLEGEATALHNLAEIHRSLNSPRQALTFYDQSLQLQWARQDHLRQALSLYGMTHALRQLGQLQQALDKYQQTLVQTDLAGDSVLASRVYHGMASLLAEMSELDQAILAMQQAVSISREIGIIPGLAHSLFALSYLFARTQQLDKARAALIESADGFKIMEDEACLQTVQQRLRQLEEDPAEMEEPPAQTGWVKSYISLVEGKVYCEYESPLAMS